MFWYKIALFAALGVWAGGELASCKANAASDCFPYCGDAFSRDQTATHVGTYNGMTGKDAHLNHTTQPGYADDRSRQPSNLNNQAATHKAKTNADGSYADNGLGGKGVTGSPGQDGGHERNNR